MKVLVTGASSMIGDGLLDVLCARGDEVVALSRSPRSSRAQVRWLRADMALSDQWMEDVGEIDAWVHLAPMPLLYVRLEEALRKLSPSYLIAFGSTSMFTKRYSPHVAERRMAWQLQKGERILARLCKARGVAWCVLRPTLIYSLGRDKNLTLIRGWIRVFRVFPLPGSGGALRQPVCADDLAKACVQLLDAPRKSWDRAYNLSGGEVLSYRAMVARLFEWEGMPARFVSVPLPVLWCAIVLLRLLPRFRHLTTAMADRMLMDMVFSHEEATRNFGFHPRPFLSSGSVHGPGGQLPVYGKDDPRAVTQIQQRKGRDDGPQDVLVAS